MYTYHNPEAFQSEGTPSCRTVFETNPVDGVFRERVLSYSADDFRYGALFLINALDKLGNERLGIAVNLPCFQTFPIAAAGIMIATGR